VLLVRSVRRSLAISSRFDLGYHAEVHGRYTQHAIGVAELGDLLDKTKRTSTAALLLPLVAAANGDVQHIAGSNRMVVGEPLLAMQRLSRAGISRRCLRLPPGSQEVERIVRFVVGARLEEGRRYYIAVHVFGSVIAQGSSEEHHRSRVDSKLELVGYPGLFRFCDWRHATSLAAMGHDHELPPPILTEVGDGIYSYVQPDGTWFINNTGFVVGEDRVVVVDATSTEARTRAFLDAIRSVTDKPISTLINTHHHGDHTHGNYLFVGATIVAHRKCREVMMAAGGISDYSVAFPDVEWGDLQFAPPSLTFVGSLELYAGNRSLTLSDLGYVAHTEGDVIMWVADAKVLFAGDLVFHGGTPFSLFGSVSGTITAMDHLASFEADVLVPGHGPVATGAAIAAALDDQRQYLGFVQERATEGIAAGRTPLEQAQATDLGRFAEWTDSERLVGNLHVAYREAGQNDDFRIDTAILDMIAFNGGARPRCLA
jgi:cyclase